MNAGVCTVDVHRVGCNPCLRPDCSARWTWQRPPPPVRLVGGGWGGVWLGPGCRRWQAAQRRSDHVLLQRPGRVQSKECLIDQAGIFSFRCGLRQGCRDGPTLTRQFQPCPSANPLFGTWRLAHDTLMCSRSCTPGRAWPWQRPPPPNCRQLSPAFDLHISSSHQNQRHRAE